jgi:hypothetical protein
MFFIIYIINYRESNNGPNNHTKNCKKHDVSFAKFDCIISDFIKKYNLMKIGGNEKKLEIIQKLSKYSFLRTQEYGGYSVIKTTEFDIKILDSL